MTTVNAELPVLLKTKEAAQLLRTSENALRQDRHYGKGAPYLKLGTRILYDRNELIEYLRSRAVRPGEDTAG